MESEIVRYLFSTFRRRYIIIALISAIGWAGALVYVRGMRTVYEATIKVFTRLPDISSRRFGVMRYELKEAIDNQKDLVQTEPICNAVHEVISGGRNKARAKARKPSENYSLGFTSLTHLLLFGDDFIKRKKEFSNPRMGACRSMISVRTDRFKTGKFVLAVKHSNPNTALKLAKVVAEKLIELNLEVSSKNTGEVASYLERKIWESENRLRKSSKAITDFIRENNIPNDSRIISSRYQQYYDSQKNVTRAEREVAQTKAQLQQSLNYVRKLKKEAQKLILSNQDVRIEAILNEIKALEYNIIKERQKGTSMKGVFNLQKNLKRLKRQLGDELEGTQRFTNTETLRKLLQEAQTKVELYTSQLESVKVEVKKLKKIQSKYARDVSRLPELQAELSRLTLEHDQLTGIHQILLKNYLDAVGRTDVGYSTLYLIDQPTLNTAIFGSNKLRILGVLSLIVLIVVMLGVASYEFTKGTIFQARQLIGFEFAHFIGVVKHIRNLKRVNIHSQFSRDTAIARMAHSLNRDIERSGTKGPKVIVLCSDAEKSGKSITSIALAHGFSRISAKTLLLDCDVRAISRSARKYYGRARAKAEGGFRDVNEILGAPPQQLRMGKFTFGLLSKDRDPTNLVEMMRTDGIRIFAGMKQRYDYIILDCPPLQFLETLLLIENSDAVIACCHEGNTTISALVESYATILKHKRQNAPVFSILTNSKIKYNQRGIYAYQGYQQYQNHGTKAA